MTDEEERQFYERIFGSSDDIISHRKHKRTTDNLPSFEKTVSKIMAVGHIVGRHVPTDNDGQSTKGRK
jgi:hypothetical protein